MANLISFSIIIIIRSVCREPMVQTTEGWPTSVQTSILTNKSSNRT